MLFEFDRQYIGLIHGAVDDHKVGVWIIRCDDLQNGTKRKTGHNNRVGAGLCKATQRLLTLCIRLQLDFTIGATSFIGPTLRAIECGFVEGFIEFAAKIEDQGRILSHCGGRT